METGAVSSGLAAAAPQSAGASALSGDDFFKLLITQLTHQDPLEPTSNEQLLQQISSIREIDLSTTLVDSLRSLTGQQRFGAASGLLGNYVTAGADPADPNAAPRNGVVVGVRFDAQGQVLLQLSSGDEVPLDQVNTITDAQRAAESLIGKLISGKSSSEPDNPQPAEGVVTSVTRDPQGQVTLNLDTGQTVKLTDVISIQAVEEPVAAAA